MNRTSLLFSLLFLFVCPFSIGAADDAPTLRVMTFNIRYGTAPDGENAWPKRREAVFETIRRFDPDVLGLQEALAFQLDEIRQALPGYKVVGVGRDDGQRRGEFSAILLRDNRLAVDASGTTWLSDTPKRPGSLTWGGQLPRVYTWADIKDRSSGRRFHVVNTHWDHQSQESRQKSARAIAQHLAQHAGDHTPALVTGDFNAGPENPALLRLLKPDTGLRDTYHIADPERQRVDTSNGFRENPSGPQIDWVLATPQWRVESSGVARDKIDGRFASDHFPVWAVVALPQQTSSRN